MATFCPNKLMLTDPVHEESVQLTYAQTNTLITKAAAAFQGMGLMPGDCVSVFSEDSHRWFITEQAIMKAGGCNAVRGVQAPLSELKYIFANSRSRGLVVESVELLGSLYGHGVEDGSAEIGGPGGVSNSSLSTSTVAVPAPSGAANWRTESGPKFVVVLFSGGRSGAELAQAMDIPANTLVLTYEEMLSLGQVQDFRQGIRDPEATATLVYTSGTTANPKGVILRHRNLLHQIVYNSFNRRGRQPFDPDVGDVVVSILPCWHIFARTSNYYFLSRGAHVIYSNLKNFRRDLPYWKPHFLVVVPRLIENMYKNIQSTMKEQKPLVRRLIALFTVASRAFQKSLQVFRNLQIRDDKPGTLERLGALVRLLFLWPLYKLADVIAWRKVRNNLGGRLKVLVSGGSLLPVHTESYFDMIGIKVIVGYGMTETSPVITNRLTESNLIGSAGKPNLLTSVKIVDPDSRQEVPRGQTGVLIAKGPQVMAGYMANAEATAKAFDAEGYFDTGDLARINPSTGDVIITGRLKDTIVLSNGENVEPSHIEDAIVAKSPLVDQAVLIGQDERFLGALLVLNPSELVKAGLMDPGLGRRLQQELGALPVSQGVQGDVEILRVEGEKLNADPAVRAAVMAAVTEVSSSLPPWERVVGVRLLLEPFTVPSGLMTQTLKMKRHRITEAYAPIISKIYSKKDS